MGTARTCLFLIILHLINTVTAQEKRLGFVGMRGKKFQDDLDLYKRKPQYLHFLGMKGKREFDMDNEDLQRAPLFYGTKGKLELPMEMYNENELNSGGSLVGEIDYSPNENFEGMPPPMFNDLLTQYLMRLQSDVSTQASDSSESQDNEISKRAANMHQFFGVRGKKSEQKRPYDVNFRGKFIGVRGKKDLQNNGVQEIKFLLGQKGTWPKRKAQTGFFGMRGKKWADESSLVNETPN